VGQNTPDKKIHPFVGNLVQKDDLIRGKSGWSCCLNMFSPEVAEKKIDTIIVSGVYAEECVSEFLDAAVLSRPPFHLRTPFKAIMAVDAIDLDRLLDMDAEHNGRLRPYAPALLKAEARAEYGDDVGTLMAHEILACRPG
jgi:hypothetical protein